ncbi:protein CMS1 [Coccidioides immitis RS]|uniref:Protein CMS1 n=2 Tax=Coccidioides immitis TaxID=5501 RepID=J3KGZ5_COCIM|nr:protein CMS1 [Coccidioides immitis RS]EAS35070.3 protein CMS1 [Coccidioides immitis RS]KMP00286.1 hypothetical protein CIRG_00428 [Coccidioides immitis RMSCC 2394]TPX26643.1 hypothetical protein DIZ76_012105 [Coccidioides immitis]
MAPDITQAAPYTKPKRKREQEDEGERPEKASNVQTSAEVPSRKRKKRNKAKQPVDDVKDAERKDGIDESIGKMDGKLLADYFAQKAKRHNKDLTAVELDDIYIPDYAFLNTSSWQSPRTLEHLPSFLKKHSPKKGSTLFQSSESKGSPHTIVITLAGLRAADMTRALREFQNKDSAVGKLFAKHIKLAEAQEFVKKTRIGIGIGTPVRLNDLIDTGALKLDSLKRIVIDGSYIDQKKRGIFDMKDLHFPLLKFLNRADLRDRYKSRDDKVEILVF